MTFGEMVRRRRRELELTQLEVAEMSGTSQQMLTQIERYNVEPKFILGCAILIALELSPMEVYKEIRLT